MHRESLDPAACAQPAQRAGQTSGTTAFQEWLSKYDGLKHKARDEDYVVHHHRKYGGELPIWIAVEFLDFGASARLFRLLDRRDQNAIAKDLGMSGGPLLANWLRDLNYLRNLCAHHARLWNRRPTYKPAKFQPAQVGAELRHAAQLEPRLKIYVHLAVLAYLVRSIDRRQNWPLALRTHLRKFPDIPDLSPEADMGFPVGWVELPLWTMKEPT